MAEYRWNQFDLAEAYDAAAEHVHPHYLEMQKVILDRLPFEAHDEFLVLDAGGGSGRLMERLLGHFPRAKGIVLDQSEAFLSIARRRLERFAPRASFCIARLQENWTNNVAQTDAIVSMSAVHHLDPLEKRQFYQRCHDHLRPNGILMNADEVRPSSDGEYLELCRKWAGHMHRIIANGLVNDAMAEGLKKWEARNVARFDEPRTSGDDCHETINVQRDYLLEAGFSRVDILWHQDLWAVIVAT